MKRKRIHDLKLNDYLGKSVPFNKEKLVIYKTGQLNENHANTLNGI
jgi:hypothetical protein